MKTIFMVLLFLNVLYVNVKSQNWNPNDANFEKILGNYIANKKDGKINQGFNQNDNYGNNNRYNQKELNRNGHNIPNRYDNNRYNQKELNRNGHNIPNRYDNNSNNQKELNRNGHNIPNRYDNNSNNQKELNRIGLYQTKNYEKSNQKSSSNNEFNSKECEQIFESRMVELHNNLRSKHRVSPLRVDTQLSSSAKSLTNRMVSSQSLSVSPDQKYGINKFAISLQKVNRQECRKFADDLFSTVSKQKSLYNYNDPGFNTETGSFTQAVWKKTTQIGCSISFTNLSKLTKWGYAACYYYPRGNVIGLFSENVY